MAHPKLKDIDCADLLPKTLREIVDVIGIGATMKLVECYGGIRVWIPAKIDSKHDLSKNIGYFAARKMCQYYALEHLRIDKAECSLRALRDHDIQSRKESDTAPTLAREYKFNRKDGMEHLVRG